jgi:hypothetical protein
LGAPLWTLLGEDPDTAQRQNRRWLAPVRHRRAAARAGQTEPPWNDICWRLACRLARDKPAAAAVPNVSAVGTPDAANPHVWSMSVEGNGALGPERRRRAIPQLHNTGLLAALGMILFAALSSHCALTFGNQGRAFEIQGKSPA